MYAAKTMLTYVTCEHLNKFHILDSMQSGVQHTYCIYIGLVFYEYNFSVRKVRISYLLSK